MMGSYHQASELFEIIFNKKKDDSLPKELQAILKHGAQAANTDNFNKAMDNYSRDLTILKEKHGVKVYKTPQSVMDAQLKAWDKVTANMMKDPFFNKVVDSQKAWSKSVASSENRKSDVEGKRVSVRVDLGG